MNEALSQSEIDALIGSAHKGEAVERPQQAPRNAGAKAIRAYDFRRPDRFSKDHLRTIATIYNAFARLVAMTMSAHLRFQVRTTIRAVDQVTYEDFIRSLPQPCVLLMIDMAPLEGKAVLEINNTFALLIVDRLLGGIGRTVPVTRPLTDLERTLIERMGDKLLPALREAWAPVVEVDPSLAGIETNPQFAQVASGGDAVLLISFEVKVPQHTGTITFCLPYVMLQPVLGRLSASTLYRSAAAGQPGEAGRVLGDTSVPITVELGQATVTFGELMDLACDDVIQLDRRTVAALNIRVADQVTFRGTPGKLGRHLAVEIVPMEGPAA